MFETPIFLLAALIGSMLPLLLHMMQKRRALPIPFSTLRFLKAAQKSASRSLRIEHLLLWLLRTLIMMLFGIAFALPVLRSGSGGGFLGRAPRDIAIVLDMSYSMGYQTGRETVFERGIDMAVDLLNGLSESDRFCIYLAGEKPQALIAEPIGDREYGLAQIKALHPAWTGSRLLPAVDAARDALIKSAGRRQMELHIITDNQELAWKRPALDVAPEDAAKAEPDRRLTLFVAFAGVPAPENVTPERVELMPPVLFQGGGARLTVRLGQTGPPRETTATFYLNGAESARRAVTTGTPAAQQIVFAVPPLPSGTHIGRVEVPSDNLAADDVFHFLVRVRDHMPTLVVGADTDTFFLRAALRAAAGGDSAFTFVPPEALGSEALGSYASIFLCNALPLPGQTVTAVERFVQRGGLVVMFPGSRAAIADYQAWQCLPGTVKENRDVSRAQTKQMLIWNAPTHPVLQTLGNALADPIIAIQRVLVLEVPETAGIVPLITLSSGLPMLLERTFGEGRVLMFAVTADRIGSNFPLTPFFMPLMAQIIEYGAGLGGIPPYIWGREQLSLDTILPDTAPGVKLTGPQGLPLSVRNQLKEGHTSLYLENATEPGIYSLAGNNGPVPLIAVNMPREESELTPLDATTVATLLEPQKVHVAVDRESLAELIHQHCVGRTYGELLLWILLALLATEFVYANRLARARGLLSEKLTIDVSGRIRGRILADTGGRLPEKGRAEMLILEHTVPFFLLLAATLVAAGIGVYSAWRYLQRNPGTLALTALYATVLAVMFWCMLQPGCRDATRQLIRPRFVVALDTSKSMTVRPNEQVETRFARAQRVLNMPWTDAVAAESEIEILAFDAEVGTKQKLGDAASLTAEGASTRLRDSLRDIAGRYTGLNVSGLLLLSDGRDTREAFDDWAADPYPFPIYTVMLEEDAEWAQEADLRVDTVISPRRVTSGWDTELKAVISGQGTKGQPITVQLFRGDNVVAEQPLLIPAAGGQRDVTFALQHTEVGVFQYRVYVPPLSGETQTADNEYSVSIAVQDPRNRLLYVEGVPRFEYRFLRRVLLASEQLSPVIFYSSANGTPRGGSPIGELTADMSESDLLQFKVVILGNLSATELTASRAANLVRFVETGGSLVLLGGTRGWGADGFAKTPLQALLPVRSHGTVVLESKDPFKVELAATARAHPAFAGDDRLWDVIPPVLSVFPDAEPKPGAEVLVEVDTPRGRQPLVVTQRYGQGRVAAIFTDSLWRWQLSPETQQHPYARFWTQLLAWMLPEADDADKRRLELFADQDQLYIGEKVDLSARFPNPEMQTTVPPEVRISLPDGRVVPFTMTPQQVVTPGGKSYPGFSYRFEPELPGFYTAEAVYGKGPDTVVSDPASFHVRAFSPETAPRPVREDLLKILASTSGGRHFETIETLNRALLNFQVSVLEEERVEFQSLWRRWMVLLVLMSLATGMWVLRKMKNMP